MLRCSIGRGFVYAGIPAVLFSLWKVNDHLTPQIFKVFYEQLAAGKTTSESLRSAKLAYLELAEGYEAFPGNWAAFTLTGENVAFQEAGSSRLYVVLAGLLSALVLFLIVRKRTTT